MSVKIRLARRGRRKAPFYHIIVADARSPRDGKFIENIGKYNPLTSPATIELDRDKAFEWLMKGAQPSDTARAILRFKGVLYRKHLARGVAKGALEQDKADQMYQDWIEAKESKISQRIEEGKIKRAEFLSAVSGSPKAIAAIEQDSADEAAEQFQNVDVTDDAPAVEAAAAFQNAVVSEDAAPVAEAAAPVVEAAAPKAEAAAPKAEAAAPKAEAAAPEVEAAAPKVEAAAPEVEAVAPVVEAAAPVVEETKVETKETAAPVAPAPAAAEEE